MKKVIVLMRKCVNKLPLLIFDLMSIPVAWFAAYWLRYNMQPFPGKLMFPHALVTLVILTLVQISCFYYFKTYRGLWQFSSLNDVIRILKAAVSGVVVMIPLFYLSSILHLAP